MQTVSRRIDKYFMQERVIGISDEDVFRSYILFYCLLLMSMQTQNYLLIPKVL